MTYHLLTIFLLLTQIQNKIEILEPLTLRNQILNETNEVGMIDYSLSLFGEVDYLRTDKIELLLPDDNNFNGCENLYKNSYMFKSNYAFLLGEEDCPLTKKALNTKFAGGLYSFVFTSNSKDDENSLNSVYKQQKISPIIRISLGTANKLRDQIVTGKRVFMKVNFDVTPFKSDEVKITYYMMINNFESMDFLQKIYDFRFSVNQNLQFEPVYYLRNFKNSRRAHRNCFFRNTYCIDFNKKVTYEYFEYKQEMVKQICLWNNVKHNKELEKEWWLYVIRFSQNCYQNNYYKKYESLQDCSAEMSKILKIKGPSLTGFKKCLSDNYLISNKDIPLFKKYIKSYKNRHIPNVPSVLVNDSLIKGFLTKTNFLSGVCDAFQSAPYECNRYYLSFKNSNMFTYKFYHFIFSFWFFGLVLILLIILVNWFMGERVTKDIRREVDYHISQYYKINDKKKKNKDVELTPGKF